MRGLTIKDGRVDNIAVFDDERGLPDSTWLPVPEGVGPGWTANSDGTYTAPAGSLAPPQSTRDLRDIALLRLVHDFGDGRVMQVRPKDEQNIRNAIEGMAARSIATTGWVMEDNVKYDVTVADLQAALAAGQAASLQVWDDYDPEA